MFRDNPVTRYVFNLDDIRGVAATLVRAAGDFAEVAGSVRAAGHGCAGLPGVGPDVSAGCTDIAARLHAAELGLRADARWLSGVAGKLAAIDAAQWTAGSLSTIVHFVHDEHTRVRKGGKRRGRLGRLAGLGVDLFGSDITGSALPQTALSYYRTASSFRGVDRRIRNVKVSLLWYGLAAQDAVNGARARAAGTIGKLLNGRADELARQEPGRWRPVPDARDKVVPAGRARVMGAAEKIAGDGHGLGGRARRVGTALVPGASGVALAIDVRQLAVQEHGYGPRGALEALRDTTSTVGSTLHLASDVLEVVPGPGTAADKAIDAAVLGTFDAAVLGMDGVDWLVFDGGADTVVHAARDTGNWALHKAGGALHALGL